MNSPAARMPAHTLAHRPLWVREEVPNTASHARLTADEHALDEDLATNTFGDRIRLEQERIAMSVLVAALWPLTVA